MGWRKGGRRGEIEVGLEPGTIIHWVLVVRGNPVGWVANHRRGSGQPEEGPTRGKEWGEGTGKFGIVGNPESWLESSGFISVVGWGGLKRV